jgi:hypothetical protein
VFKFNSARTRRQRLFKNTSPGKKGHKYCNRGGAEILVVVNVRPGPWWRKNADLAGLCPKSLIQKVDDSLAENLSQY